MAFLIKAPTSSIKALIAGCPLKLVFGKKDSYLCTGVRIMDMPDAPVFISRLQRNLEEHSALIQALNERTFPLFLFNEMDVCLAWTNIELSAKDAFGILNFIGQDLGLYVGPFTHKEAHVLDCFCHSVDKTNIYPNAHAIPTMEINTNLEKWHVIDNYFYGKHSYHKITIDDKNEGEMLERAIWASLESVFPLTLYKGPQVKIGEKLRELTDVFSFYTYGSFLIEAKDLSILNAGYQRDQVRRTASVQKQVKKAITQLVGASKAFLRGDAIFDTNGNELNISRKQPPHCIILITELMHYGDWQEIVTQLMKAMNEVNSFFHFFDLREFITILKCSSGEAEQLDYNLMQRCKLFIEKQSVFIRSQPFAP